MEEKARVAYIDIAAGIMIIWLLIYHALWPMYKSDVLCAVPFLFFFMPWFFYKSGYFFSPKALSETFKNDAIKLLKTYVVWSLIGYVCYILQHFFYYNSLSFTEIVYNPLRSLCFYGLIPLNTPLWFLPVLFMVHQLANLLCKCGNLLWI